jgi:lipoate---protein ligase
MLNTISKDPRASIIVVDSGVGPAKSHMEGDRLLLEQLSLLDRPLLHYYRWETTAITYGHFINPWNLLKEEQAQAFDIVRRPTGGGLIFHYNDFSFSVALPHDHPKLSNHTLENYHLLNSCVISCLKQLLGTTSFSLELLKCVENSRSLRTHFCMASPTQYDIMLDGCKVGGAAQRKTKWGLLHQSSIFLLPPNWDEIESTLKDPHIVQDMKMRSTSLSDLCNSTSTPQIARQELASTLIQSVESCLC